MNVRFRRLNKKTPAPAKPEMKAAPLLDLPPQIIIDDWLKRERRKKQDETDGQRQRIKLPVPGSEPLTEVPDKQEEPWEIIIDLNNPDNLVN